MQTSRPPFDGSRMKGAQSTRADTHLLRGGFISLYDGKVE